MLSQYSNHWQNEISIQYENTRFAFMFILFALFAFTTTIALFNFGNHSYRNESEVYQQHWIPCYIMASISLALFLIFFIGSLVYTSKSIRKLRFKSSSLNSINNTIKIMTIESSDYHYQTNV